MEWVRVLAAFVGLGAALSFAQSTRLGYSGPIGRAGSWLYLPALAACLLLLVFDFGWWTVGVFVVIALAVGALNGLYIRASRSPAALLSVQPLLVGLFLVGTALAAVARLDT